MKIRILFISQKPHIAETLEVFFTEDSDQVHLNNFVLFESMPCC